MVPGSWRRFDTLVYRTALRLCPSSFRRAYADDMIRDFAEARDEVSSERAGGLWWLWAAIAIDIARTIVVQWARTGLPAIALVSVVMAVVVAEAVATVFRRATSAMQTDLHDELIGVLFLASTSVVVIAMTIVLTLWVARLNRRRRSR